MMGFAACATPANRQVMKRAVARTWKIFILPDRCPVSCNEGIVLVSVMV